MGGQSSKLGWPVIDLRGKTVIITGANSGIGFETAKHLAIMGARVILACRSETRAQAAMLRMQADYLEIRNTPIPNFSSISPSAEGESSNTLQVPGQNEDAASDAGSTHSGTSSFITTELTIEYMPLDLSSLQSVTDFATAFKEKNLDLHLLICNAGVMGVPRSLTQDRYEMHFQVNYLGHFLLTLYLLPILRQSGDDCRIINISDAVHSDGKLELNNINGKKSYDRTGFYANSKLYQIMSSYALQRRLNSSNISVFSIHPGAIDTNISKNIEDQYAGKMLRMSKRFGMITTDLQKGAATTINVAVSPHMKELRGYYFASGIPATPSPRSRDVKKQEALWNFSLEGLKDRISTDMMKGLSIDDMSTEDKELVEDALKIKGDKNK